MKLSKILSNYHDQNIARVTGAYDFFSATVCFTDLENLNLAKKLVVVVQFKARENFWVLQQLPQDLVVKVN